MPVLPRPVETQHAARHHHPALDRRMLIHYELWLITGRWAGGGHTHTTNDAVTYLPPH
jgi:hypothetical protein